MKQLCPSYNLKSRQYFTHVICDKLYGKVSQKILELLKSFDKMSFTSDIWSDSCSGVSLLSLTCHGITKEFERKMIVLKAEVFNDGRHTGENIMQKLEGILSTWEIPKEKVKCVVRDAGANMKKGVSLLNVDHIDCTSHKLQNVLKEGLKAQETVMAAIMKCKKIAAHFHHSTSAQDELFQEAVCLYASTTNNKIPQLTSEEWIILKKLVGLIQPFEDVTKELSSANVSVSSVIPLIATLQKILDEHDSTDEHIAETIITLRDELNRKFGFLENETLFVTATFIDPRYKIKFFKSNLITDRVTQHILDLLGDSEASAPSCSHNAKRARLNETDPDPTHKGVSFRETMESLMDDTSDSEDDIPLATHQNPVHLLIRKTLTEYLAEKRWKVNQEKYGLICPIARHFLVTPPTSVPSERVFSGAGLIYTPHRSRLEGEKASKLLFLKFNIPLLKFDY
ncbi:hypothetical protein ABMA27_003195 [Loxostege sticticalis]|uniref:HAT C-terminal dimerisation domain-containing protein n=1 Tax=Loxostege sticticalis TaxID=481309 RepID=A0ABR3HSA7_LOXSC